MSTLWIFREKLGSNDPFFMLENGSLKNEISHPRFCTIPMFVSGFEDLPEARHPVIWPALQQLIKVRLFDRIAVFQMKVFDKIKKLEFFQKRVILHFFRILHKKRPT